MWIAHELKRSRQEVLDMDPDEFFEWRAYFVHLNELKKRAERTANIRARRR